MKRENIEALVSLIADVIEDETARRFYEESEAIAKMAAEFALEKINVNGIAEMAADKAYELVTSGPLDLDYEISHYIRDNAVDIAEELKDEITEYVIEEIKDRL